MLEQKLSAFLGFKRSHPAVMIGCGSLGSALIADRGLQNYGLHIVAGFDTDSSLAGKIIDGVEIYPMSRLEELRPSLDAEIAVIAVPVENAQNAADHAVAAGIKALWNFTPLPIAYPRGYCDPEHILLLPSRGDVQPSGQSPFTSPPLIHPLSI